MIPRDELTISAQNRLCSIMPPLQKEVFAAQDLLRGDYAAKSRRNYAALSCNNAAKQVRLLGSLNQS